MIAGRVPPLKTESANENRKNMGLYIKNISRKTEEIIPKKEQNKRRKKQTTLPLYFFDKKPKIILPKERPPRKIPKVVPILKIDAEINTLLNLRIIISKRIAAKPERKRETETNATIKIFLFFFKLFTLIPLFWVDSFQIV